MHKQWHWMRYEKENDEEDENTSYLAVKVPNTSEDLPELEKNEA